MTDQLFTDDEGHEFDLSDFIGELDEPRLIYVYRRGRGSPAFLDSFDPAGFSLEGLREAFGGGLFQLRLKDEKGRWAGGSRTVRIEGPPKAYRPDDDDDDDDDAPDVAGQVAKLAAGLAAMREEFARARANPEPAGGGGDSFSEAMKMVELIARMQSLGRPEAPASSAGTETAALETFLRGFEMGREMTIPTGGGVSDLAERYLPRMLELMGNKADTAHTSAPASAAPPPSPAPPGLDVSQLPDPPPKWAAFLAPHLPSLAEKAAAGKDPELWADVLLEGVPEGYYPIIRGEVERPELFNELGAAFPPARDFAEWFLLFIGRIRENLTPEE